MERFSDLYGFSGLDLEAARTCLEEALNIRLTAHESNINNIFKKLMKDYEKGADQGNWLNQIIEKEVLVGKDQRIPTPTESLTSDNSDSLINKTDGNNRNDTGLYELYKNVVERFNQNLIHLAESYRDNSDPTNDLRQWVARTGQVNQTTDTTRQGIAYGYGGRQTINQFNTTVSKHGAPSYTNIETNPLYLEFRGYQANIGDASDTEPSELRRTHGIVGAGTRKWPGLYRGIEYNSGIGANALPRYYHENWAGVDCTGLTLHGLRYAERPADYAPVQRLTEMGDSFVPGIRVADVCVSENCSATDSVHTRNALSNTNVRRFFATQNIDLLHYWGRTDEATKLLHRGDVIRYGDTHISIMHSEKPAPVDAADGGTSVSAYEIIHAYGGDSSGMYTYPFHDTANAGTRIFGRRVLKTWENIETPTGFGRIKLWD